MALTGLSHQPFCGHKYAEGVLLFPVFDTMLDVSVVFCLVSLVLASAKSLNVRYENGSVVASNQIRFRSGANVSLDCAFNASVNSTSESLQWIRNGSGVTESSSVNVSVRQFFVGGAQRLYISQLTRERQGVYTCVGNASNSTGGATRAMFDVFVWLDEDG